MLPLWQATGLQRDPNAQEITVRRQTKALNHTTHFRRVSNTLPAVRVLISNTSDWAYTLARPPCRNTGSIRATAPSGRAQHTHPQRVIIPVVVASRGSTKILRRKQKES